MGFKVGDKARCINADGNACIRKDDVYVIRTIDPHGYLLFEHIFGGHYYKPELFEPVFKYGDKVACVAVGDSELLKKGAIYTIRCVNIASDTVRLQEHPTYRYPTYLFERHKIRLAGFKPIMGHMVDENNGGSSDHYKLPKGAKDLQDLIEYKEMSFSRGNIFKAVWRLGGGGRGVIYDLNKIIWFAKRMRDELTTKRTGGTGRI